MNSDVGRPLVSQLGVESGWASDPVKLGGKGGDVLGTETTVETFAGRTNDGEVALVHMVRVEHDGDAVLVGDGRTRPLEEGEQSQPPAELVSANERRFGQTQTEYKEWAVERLQDYHTTTVTYTGDNKVTAVQRGNPPALAGGGSA